MTIASHLFIAWVQSLLGREVPTPGTAPGKGLGLYPGLDDTLLTQEAYTAGVAERERKSREHSRRWDIAREVRKRLAEEQPDLKGTPLRLEVNRLQREQCEAEGIPFDPEHPAA